MGTPRLPERLLSLAGNSQIVECNDIIRIERTSGTAISLEFASGPAFVLRSEKGGWFVLPSVPESTLVDGNSIASAASQVLDGDSIAWVLPPGADESAPAWCIQAPAGSPITLHCAGTTIAVEVHAGHIDLRRYESRPHADIFGSRYSLQIEDGPRLEQTLAAFYWDTILPCVVERTRAATFPTPDGYVLSTLSSNYLGTYPDVDHEFQVKGRLASGNPLDEDVVRRMLELQFQVMRADPDKSWRDPCSVQPDGTCEYHVRRSSMDGNTTATMFLITGNVEILEEAFAYVCATHSRGWLTDHILDLEGAASGIEAHIDSDGLLWSDVYFEDQVMQDGRVCDAQAFSANGFHLLAEMEALLGRDEQAHVYQKQSERLARMLVAPLPRGYWDPGKQRFTNWVDRKGVAHDHVHLLSNELPVLFGHATHEQAQAVLRLVDENLADFQRFPSFVALELAGYTASEIGDGGPYDLCAAGRYWCWDAAFWSWRKDREMLHRQLVQVAKQAESEAYHMDERYDMDHIYYIDGKDSHGAAHYYEYPCVFTWVLLHEYLGLGFAMDVDLVIAPCLYHGGHVELHESRFAVSYTYDDTEGFTLQNLADHPRTFRVDLSALYLWTKTPVLVTLQPGESSTLRPAAQ